MLPRDWEVRIEDILEALSRIESYTQGMTLEDFNGSQVVVDAVMHNLLVISEKVQHVPSEIQATYPNIPWEGMRGMRTNLALESFGVSLPIIWQTIAEDLPPLSPQFYDILRGEGDSSGTGG